MKTLREALALLDQPRVGDATRAAASRIGAAYEQAIADIVRGGKTVYGVNTYPGHLAENGLAPDPDVFSRMLLQSHAIGGAPYFDQRSARAITAAKVLSIRAGGQLISEATFLHVLRCLEDGLFHPKIPMHASYSSGDVIPGAHWACAVVDHPPGVALRPGEAMALINGAFVHAGALLGIVGDVRAFWLGLVETLRASLPLCTHGFDYLLAARRPEQAWLGACLDYLCEGVGETAAPSPDVQPPVSIRATRQSLEAAAWAIDNLLKELDHWLDQPSNNPLLVAGADGPAPTASFVNPTLALASSAVIDALLMLDWLIARRALHLTEAARRLAPSADIALALIQAPKLMQAMVERERRSKASRVFVTGSSTSHEIEDFWTHGVETAHHLREAIETTSRMLLMESALARSVAEVAAGKAALDIGKTLAKHLIAAQGDPRPLDGLVKAPAHLFPV